jgi:hypothetical protein
MTTNSLKATKKAIKAPTKAVNVLSDNVKLALAHIVNEGAIAYQFGLDHEVMVKTKQVKEQEFAENFVNYVKDNALKYDDYLMVKQHVQSSLALSKKQEVKTIEIWLNKIVKAYLSIADLKGWVLPKAESASAKSMGALRSALASLSDSELEAQIIASAEAQDFKKAAQLSTEKIRRDTQAKNAIKKSEGKAITQLKTTLKEFIAGLTPDQLAVMMYVKNHFSEVTELYTATQ